MNCFAIRRLNPVLGVSQIVESRQARAYSSDGLNWHIEILADLPSHTWARGPSTATGKRFVHFGDWSMERGMAHVMIIPVLDIGAMLAAGEEMAGILERHAMDVPFDLADSIELWLLDAQQYPVALLAAITDERLVEEIHVDRWRAGTELESGRADMASDAGDGARHWPWRTLEDSIRSRGGQQQWFAREPDGSGTALRGESPELGGRVFPAELFPELGLVETWDQADDARLVQDYLAWRAPWLLTWPTLSDSRRGMLEQVARHDALPVAENHRLYPKQMRPELIQAARVEARLRLASQRD